MIYLIIYLLTILIGFLVYPINRWNKCQHKLRYIFLLCCPIIGQLIVLFKFTIIVVYIILYLIQIIKYDFN